MNDKAMSDRNQRLQDLFVLARELPAEDHDAFLAQHCGGDGELRSQLATMLRADREDAMRFLDSPVLAAPPDLEEVQSDDAVLAELPEKIGSYRILECLGEGGMGVVYLAEQTEPVRREVAVKVVKPGMDTRQVVARFEAERQTLALMSHPGIARIFDAGATPRRASVLRHGARCADSRWSSTATTTQLSTNARLELFREVCDAVQHAHQKGIIHRDLKPSNVLVAEVDGKPEPKVIDFGMARAIEPDTERSFHTEQEQWVGTFHYMSPEQAGKQHDDIDSRSDIYSLGVLLYELLTGELPFGREAMRLAGPEEFRRVLEEQTPASPSSRVRQSDTTLELARHQATDPRTLSRRLKGELDWMTMKAIAPEREQRYSSAGELAADVGRYLRHEPVLAGRPSATYRLRKFVRRNRVSVAAGVVVLAALLVGGVITTLALLEAQDQRDEATLLGESLTQANENLEEAIGLAESARGAAETDRDAAQAAKKIATKERLAAERVTELLTDLLALANPENASIADSRQILEHASRKIETAFAEHPRARARAHRMIGEAYASLSDYDSSFGHLRRALEIVDGLRDFSLLERSEVLWAHHRVARATQDFSLENDAFGRWRWIPGDLFLDDHVELARLLVRLNQNSDRSDVSSLGEGIIQYAEANLEQQDPRWVVLADRLLFLVVGQRNAGLAEWAIRVYEDRAGFSSSHTRVFFAKALAAKAHYLSGNLEQLEGMSRQWLEEMREILPTGHHYRTLAQMWIGTCLCRKGEFDEGEALLRACARDFHGPRGPTHHSAYALHLLAESHHLAGNPAQGSALARQLVEQVRENFTWGLETELVRTVLGPEHADLATLFERFSERSEKPGGVALGRRVLEEWRSRLTTVDDRSALLAMAVRPCLQNLGNAGLAPDLILSLARRALASLASDSPHRPGIQYWAWSAHRAMRELHLALDAARDGCSGRISGHLSAGLHRAIATTLQELGHECALEMATEAYEEMLREMGEANRNMNSTTEVLARALVEAGDWDGLEGLLRNRLERLLRQSGSPHSLWHAAYHTFMAEDFKPDTLHLALQAVQKAQRMEPGNPRHEVTIGFLLSRLEDHEAAIEQLSPLVGVSASLTDIGDICIAHAYLAMSYAALGQAEKARAELARAIESSEVIGHGLKHRRTNELMASILVAQAEAAVRELEAGIPQN